MPIRFSCWSCGKRYVVRDEIAGRVGLCSNCGHQMTVPSPSARVPDDALTPPPIPSLPIASAPDTKPCPFCAEQIKIEAKKCRYCGEMLDPILRSVQEHSRKSTHRDDADFSRGLAMLLSFCLPGMGQIYRGDTRKGVNWMLGTLAAYCCVILPGLVVHLLCIIDAGKVS
jgi:hypothetical protein